MERILLVISICLLALLFPWWVFLVAMLLVAFRYSFFVEGILIAALYDVLYATHALFGVRFFVTALALVICCGVFFIRRYTRYDAFSS